MASGDNVTKGLTLLHGSISGPIQSLIDAQYLL